MNRQNRLEPVCRTQLAAALLLVITFTSVAGGQAVNPQGARPKATAYADHVSYQTRDADCDGDADEDADADSYRDADSDPDPDSDADPHANAEPDAGPKGRTLGRSQRQHGRRHHLA